MNVAAVYADARRLLRAWRRHAVDRRADRKSLGLAHLELCDEVAMPGRTATYRTAVTDLGTEPREVELVLDLWIREPAVERSTHVGYVAADLRTEPRARVEIEMTWNGVDAGAARVGDTRLPCRTHFGAVNHPGPCDVILTLRSDGRVADQVQARQTREAVP